MSSITVACPFCGSKAKRFILPNGIATDYFICEVCNKTFTLSQSRLGELARKMFNSKTDMITTSKVLLEEREFRYKERL